MDKTCKTCRFSSEWYDYETYIEKGYCNRFPPQNVVSTSGRVLAMRPYVFEDSWCGEWNPKEDDDG